MRRPVKPFVTEYRASGRRGKEGLGKEGSGKDGSGKEGPAEEGRPPRGASPDRKPEAFRGNLAPRDLFRPAADATDSHEAVMRAADALFSPRRDAVVTEAAGSEFEATGTSRSPELATAAEPTGRVLRALDEPEPEPAAMTADEPAPRRRQRGERSATAPRPAPRRAARRPAAPALHPATEAAAPELRTAAVAGGGDAAIAAPLRGDATAEGASAAPAAGRRREPFAWVRTKLRPGEKWKRRLPKVAW